MPKISKYGDYYLTTRLATGGMAELFRALKPGEAGFVKTLAVKRLLPHLAQDQDFVAMFLDEARLASRLTHQNIAQVYDLGRVEAGPDVEPLAGDTYFIAMEYVFGKNLAEIFRAGQERLAMLSSANVASIVLSVAAALDYAHSLCDHDMHPLGVVHRDISPANILISYEGEIKLVDFGIAKALSQSSSTRPGVFKGKFAYMSPEQAKGLPVDNRSDIFSLGAVLWEGLTGTRLFAADSEAATIKMVAEAAFVLPSQAGADCPPRLDAICAKCLAADRAARYQSAQGLARDLEEYLRSLRSYPGAYSLRSHLHALFAGRIEQEREEIRQEDEAFKLMLAGADTYQSRTASTLSAHQAPPPPPVAPHSAPARPRPRGARAKSRGLSTLYLVAGAAAISLFFFLPHDRPPAPMAPTGRLSPGRADKATGSSAAAPPKVSSQSQAQPLETQRRQVQAYLKAGRYQEAWDVLLAMVAAEPWLAPQLAADRLAAALGLARTRMDSSPVAALAWLDRARALAPESAEVNFQVGRALTKLERWDEALAAYRRAVELDPQLSGAHFNMGYILLKQERTTLAVAAFQRVVGIGGDLVADALTNLGVCYARLGDREKAAAMFQQALAKNPADAMARKYLEQVRGAGERGR